MIKLPQPVISLIESHISPSELPFLPLRTILDSSLRSSALVPRPANTSIQRLSQQDIQRHRTSVSPFNFKRFLPRLQHILNGSPGSTEKALIFTLRRLREHATTSELGTKKERQSNYDTLISVFLGHPEGLKPATTLLFNGINEGTPPTPSVLTQFLKRSFEDGQPVLPTIRTILPHLPERVDLKLLTTILRALVRDAGLAPGEVEKMIKDCMQLEGKEKRIDWPWDLWDILLLAHARQKDFRSAVKLLGEFKQVVKTTRQIRTADTTLNDNQLWTTHEMDLISRPYVTVMALWTDTRRFNIPDSEGKVRRNGHRLGSMVPRRLAKDLTDLLGEVHCLPVAFCNAWMNAERVAENYHEAFTIWRMMYGFGEYTNEQISSWTLSTSVGREHSKSLTQQPHVSQLVGHRTLRPDVYSWISLFKLFKHANSQYLEPLRPVVKDLFIQLSTFPSAKSTKVLNALLSAIFQTNTQPDLPLVHVVLNQFKSLSTHLRILPDERTIDIVVGGLVQLRREQSALTGLFRHRAGSRNKRNLKRRSQLGSGTTYPEWGNVSMVLHSLREDLEGEVERIRLPLARPLAELSPEDYPSGLNLIKQPIISLNESSMESTAMTSPTPSSPPINAIETHSSLHFNPPETRRASNPEILLNPTIKLVERAIFLLRSEFEVSSPPGKSADLEQNDGSKVSPINAILRQAEREILGKSSR